MTIETRCNDCGTILTIADEHAGKLARCPHCKAEYTVPDQTDEVALDAVCDFCGVALKVGAPEDSVALKRGAREEGDALKLGVLKRRATDETCSRSA